MNFDKAFRCGIYKILDNGGSAMDDDARAWRAIVSSYEKAWPDCGSIDVGSVGRATTIGSRMTRCMAIRTFLMRMTFGSTRYGFTDTKVKAT